MSSKQINALSIPDKAGLGLEGNNRYAFFRIFIYDVIAEISEVPRTCVGWREKY